MRLGFLGLGFMGVPMARILSRRFPLIVWNQSPTKYVALKKDRGKVSIGETHTKVVENLDIIFMMLFNAAATSSILSKDLKKDIRGKILVNTSLVTVEFSKSFDEEVREASGQFLEMPVSGSKIPVEQGQLVAMMSGDPDLAKLVEPFVEPLSFSAIYCDPIGSGLKAKYAVNTLLITLTVGLAESMNLAQAQGLNFEAFAKVLDACPMASPYSKIRVGKMLNQDWSPQAATKDCYNSTQLIQSAAVAANSRSPLTAVCGELYAKAMGTGMGEEDMISVAKQIASHQT